MLDCGFLSLWSTWRGSADGWMQMDGCRTHLLWLQHSTTTTTSTCPLDLPPPRLLRSFFLCLSFLCISRCSLWKIVYNLLLFYSILDHLLGSLFSQHCRCTTYLSIWLLYSPPHLSLYLLNHSLFRWGTRRRRSAAILHLEDLTGGEEKSEEYIMHISRDRQEAGGGGGWAVMTEDHGTWRFLHVKQQILCFWCLY